MSSVAYHALRRKSQLKYICTFSADLTSNISKADSSGKIMTSRRGLCHDEPEALSGDNTRLMHVQRDVLWALPSAFMVRRS